MKFKGVEFKGQPRKRYILPTGYYSFDRALRGGLYLPSAYELYGFTHVGKSTLAYDLAGRVRPDGNIALADFEHFDPEYMAACLSTSNFSGRVDILDVNTGEETLTAIRNCILDTDYQAAILDSVGALMPEQEIKEKITLQQRIGLKPKLMARGMRAAMYALMRNPRSAFFIINHLHPIISLGRGATTSGGVAIHNLSGIRIKLKTEKSDELYSIVQGRIDKHRWAGKGGNFKFVIVPGMGIHPGLTAVTETIWAGIAEEDKTIKMNGNSHGYFKTLVKKALDGNTKVFEPFVEALNELGATNRPDSSKKDSSKKASN